MTGKSRRGFASMDPARQREIASKGGRAAHEKGTAHEWSANEARDAGRKGGVTVSRDRDHMAAIGREGGESRSAAARQARLRLAEREVPLSISRDGDSRPADKATPDRSRPEGRPDIRLMSDAPSDNQVAGA
jgi:general stress protein YciG